MAKSANNNKHISQMQQGTTATKVHSLRGQIFEAFWKAIRVGAAQISYPISFQRTNTMTEKTQYLSLDVWVFRDGTA